MKICALGVSSSIHVKLRTLCFSKLGHDVVVISPVETKIEGVDNIYLPQRWRFGIVSAGVYLVTLIAKLLRNRPDVIHIHSASFYELVASYLSGIPYIVTLMGSDVLKRLDGDIPWLKRKIMVFCLRRASFLNPVSNRVSEVLQKHVQGADLVQTGWGIDLTLFRPRDEQHSREKFGIPIDRQVILGPRLIKPLYNTDVLVKALPIVRKSIDAHLVLVGYFSDPEFYKKVKELVFTLKLEDYVTVIDYVDNQDMPWLYSAANVVVAIPDSDGFPISLCEAIACCRPNVLSRLSLYDELVSDNRTALYTDVSPDRVAASIVRVLEDKEFRESMVLEARESNIQRINFDDNVALIERELLKVIQ